MTPKTVKLKLEESFVKKNEYIALFIYAMVLHEETCQPSKRLEHLCFEESDSEHKVVEDWEPFPLYICSF